MFRDRSFFESLRLEPYYGHALANIPEASFLRDLMEQTRQRRFALVHGDYSPKNILIHESRLVLLDHEVIHFGDPAFDIGFSLTHILSKAHHLSEHRVELSKMAHHYWASYRSALGDSSWDPDFEHYAVQHALGCLIARVAGKSPLEYLTDAERKIQAQAVRCDCR